VGVEVGRVDSGEYVPPERGSLEACFLLTRVRPGRAS